MIGILLAAGFSRRFGSSDKLLHILPNGIPMALMSAENLIKAMPISIAVVRPDNKTLSEMLLSKGLQVVACDDGEQEMANSLATAIRLSAHFRESADGFVIALADMPYIKPETIRAVANRVAVGASIVIPTYQNQHGHPVGFSAKFRPELENLQGDVGARSVIKRYTDEAVFLAIDDAGILTDIDTLADLKL